MTGPIDTGIDMIGDRFLQIDPNPSNPARNAPNQVLLDGPLNHALGGIHNEKSDTVNRFVVAMVQGMSDTGVALKAAAAGYKDVDKSKADSIRKLFTPPPGAPGAAPEGGR